MPGNLRDLQATERQNKRSYGIRRTPRLNSHRYCHLQKKEMRSQGGCGGWILRTAGHEGSAAYPGFEVYGNEHAEKKVRG